MLSANVKTALGLEIIRKETILEEFMDMIWCFVGLTMFGWGIGNISS